MVRGRPFKSIEDLLERSDATWRSTEAADWHEAFAHHPRIGERRSEATQSALAREWSGGEQTGMQQARSTVQDELADVNRAYEERFGHIYIVCATGRTAGEMLTVAKERMRHDPATELRVAAEEQRKITQLRLRKLLGETT